MSSASSTNGSWFCHNQTIFRDPNFNCSQSRTIGPMCCEDSQVHSSAEDAIAAEESLSAYYKPVKLYNVLEHRAVKNPSFLQRCLEYKIREKCKRRINMTVSLSWSMNKGVELQRILPLYVLLVTPVPELAAGGHSAVYCCRTRAHILTCSSEFESKGGSKADFYLPEIKKLSDESKIGKLFILLVSCGDPRNSFSGGNLLNHHIDTSSSPASVGGYCLWGKISMESLYVLWEKSTGFSSEYGSGMLSTVDMQSCFLEPSSLEKEQCITFKTPDNPVTMKLHVNIFAREGEEKDSCPYSSFKRGRLHTSSLPHITRMRTSKVVFNYKDDNNTVQKTEVTTDFSCAFCLVKCASFQGLRYHLPASHDLFNFEFWVSEEYQAVYVSVKKDVWRSKMVTDGVDPKLQTFFLCSKRLKRKRAKNSSQNAKHVYTHAQELASPKVTRNGLYSDLLEKEADTHSKTERDSNTGESNGATNASAAEYMERVASSPNVPGVLTATAQSSTEPECLPLGSERNHGHPAMLQFAKTRKLSVERSDPRKVFRRGRFLARDMSMMVFTTLAFHHQFLHQRQCL